MGEVNGVRSGPDLCVGDHVKLMTRDHVVAHFGRGKDPDNLTIGRIYTITEVEIHDYHTLIWVEEHDAELDEFYAYGPFNEALFEHQPR